MAATMSMVIGREDIQRLEKSPTASCLFDRETLRCLAANEAALRLYGYTRSEFLKLSLVDTRHPDDDREQPVPRASAPYPRHGGVRRHVTSSGDIFLADVVVQDVVFEGREAWFFLILDRSEKGRTQVALLERERLFSALVEHAPDIIARIDRDLRHVYVNPAIETATGLKPDQVIGRTSKQIGAPLGLCTRWAAGVRRVLATGREQDLEVIHSTPHGARYYESRMVPELSAAGEIESVLAIARDITERKEVEFALRASEAQLQQSHREFESLADALPQVITCFDRELRHTYANAAVERQMGIPRSELLGRTNNEVAFPPALAAKWNACLRRVYDTGETVEVEYSYPVGAGLTTYEARYIPLTDAQGEVDNVLCVAYDITGRLRSEQERLATVSQQRDTFMREVHHRVKNNLQGVVGLLRQNASSQATLMPFLDKAISQLQAIATVHDLQARGPDESVSLQGMIEEVVKSVERATGATIQYRGNVNDNVWRLRENEAVAIALVLNELITNAGKHGAADKLSRVAVSCVMKGQRAEIAVRNRGALPAGFDFDAGTGLGTGLELVKALLPPNGASLACTGNDGHVRVVLEISPSLLVRADQDAVESADEWGRRKRAHSDRR